MHNVHVNTPFHKENKRRKVCDKQLSVTNARMECSVTEKGCEMEKKHESEVSPSQNTLECFKVLARTIKLRRLGRLLCLNKQLH